MIFDVEGHIPKILVGQKTETRRVGTRIYRVGHTYSIQSCRTCKGIPDGRILILKSKTECCTDRIISFASAKAEGGYDPTEYEVLFSKMHPSWKKRMAYTFKYVPNNPHKQKCIKCKSLLQEYGRVIDYCLDGDTPTQRCRNCGTWNQIPPYIPTITLDIDAAENL